MRLSMLLAAALSLAACGRPQAPVTTDAENSHQPSTRPAVDGGAAQAPAGAEQAQPAAAAAERPASGACLSQDGKQVPENAIRAVGTEPFWAARVEGRCVTYSTPENQSGTRVWARFSGTSANGNWTGALEGDAFVMITRPEQGCSDGMSDKRYPIAVELRVQGETRRGCAEPL